MATRMSAGPYQRIPSDSAAIGGSPWESPYAYTGANHESEAGDLSVAYNTNAPNRPTAGNGEQDAFTKPTFQHTSTEDTVYTTNPTTSFVIEEDSDNKAKLLPRFYLRGIMCILVPAIYTAYFIFIWRYFVRRGDDLSRTRMWRRASKQHFYAWFILGVIALNLSRYGLAGVEASMLMHRYFRARNAMQLIMHCDKTWAGPSGWMKVISKSFRGQFKQIPSLSWWILAVASIIPFIAVPLSGLTFELSDGYDLLDTPATLVGTNETLTGTFSYEINAATFHSWRNNQPPLLRRRSALYLPPGGDLPDWIQEFPNQWDDSPEATVFVAPQSDNPVAGTAWGIRAYYNCTIAKSINDFWYLKHRNESETTEMNAFESATGSRYSVVVPAKKRGDRLSSPACLKGYPSFNETNRRGVPLPEECGNVETYVFNQTSNMYYSVPGILEIAVDNVIKRRHFRAENADIPGEDPFNAGSTGRVEIALWQTNTRLSDEDRRSIERLPHYDMKGHIPEMEGFYEIYHAPLKAIGVICQTDFRGGYAEVNGFTSRFDKFQPKTPLSGAYVNLDRAWQAIPRILVGGVFGAKFMPQVPDGHTALTGKLEGPLDGASGDLMKLRTDKSDFLAGLFTSVDKRDLYLSTLFDESFQIPLLDAEDLQLAIIRLFKHYAVAIMSGTGAEWKGNLTESEPVKIIIAGPLPPEIVIVLMSIWAGLSCILGLYFAFRRRWSDTLDGFSMFRFGTDYSSKRKKFATQNYESCGELLTIPGLVGDSKPMERIGRISLVANPVADKKKKYL